jgi:hypothetical protein
MNTRNLVATGALCTIAALAAPAGADSLRVGHGPQLKDGSGSGAGSWIGYTGGSNTASGAHSAVAAGSFNAATNNGSFVGAGQSNSANGVSSLVIGGFDNHAIAIDSLVGAGAGNRTTGPRAVVVGGGYNLASGPWSFIGGGGRETGSGTAGASAQDHVAMGKWSTIGGGQGNRAGGSTAQTGATVAGGEQNQAVNTDATVGGGTSNVASGLAATIPGGSNNTASGDYSFAAGRRAKATQTGSIVFADGSNFDFTASAANQFSVRAVGGARIVSAINGSGTPTAGVTLAAGAGSWASLSDRNAKHDFAAVDARAVAAKVAKLPLYTWRYNAELSQALHMGPTAQDFHAAFGLGDSDRTITTIDGTGVALAAIQGLAAELRAQDAILAAQGDEFAHLKARLARLERARDDVALLKATLAGVIAARQGGLVTTGLVRR